MANNQAHMNEEELQAEDPSAVLQPGTPAAQFAHATKSLTALIAQENRLLDERDIDGIKPLQGEKARLTAVYEQSLKSLRANPTLLGPKDSLARKALRKITSAFQEEIKANGRILLRMKSVTEGIVNSISEEASRQSGQLTHYNRQAHSSRRTTGGPAPIVFHEVI